MVGAGVVVLALYNVFTKKLLNNQIIWKSREAALTALITGIASAMFFVVAVATGGPQIHDGFWRAAIITGVLNVGVLYGHVRSKALEDVSLVVPISSTTPALVIVVSMFILGEFPTPLGWLGVWLLAVGTYVLNIQDFWQALAKRRQIENASQSKMAYYASIWFAPFLALRSSAGVRWAFGVALLATISLNYDGVVARTANIAFGCGCTYTIAAVGNLAIALSRREFDGLRPANTLKGVLPLAVMFVLIHLLINPAFRETLVSYVGTLKRLSIPLTIIFAYLLVGEKKSFLGRLGGGLVMAIGATLIALGMQ